VNLPVCDDPDYLEKVVVPQLSTHELMVAMKGGGYAPELRDKFVKDYSHCGICPRRIIGAPSGQRLELCTCIHGETDAVTKARRPLFDCWMICACGVPCIDCTKIILEAGLHTVVAVVPADADEGGDYSPYSSRWMFEKSNTNLLLVPPEWFTATIPGRG
jgi:deoxycytidylate deaminase